MATINKHRNDEAPKLVGIRSAVVVAEAVPLSRESGDGAVERERERGARQVRVPSSSNLQSKASTG